MGTLHLSRLMFSLLTVALVATSAQLLVPSTCDAHIGEKSLWEKLNLSQDPEPVLKDVLSRKEFREAQEQSWIDLLRERALEGLRRLLIWLTERWPSVPSLSTDTDILRIILEVTGIALLTAAILYIVLRLVRVLGAAHLHGKRDTRDQSNEDRPPQDGRMLWKIALQAAEDGRHRDALIMIFRAVLLELDQRGKLSYHPGRTNREILNSVNPQAPLRQTLNEMVPLFNRVFYGNYACTKTEYERFAGLCDRAMEGA